MALDVFVLEAEARRRVSQVMREVETDRLARAAGTARPTPGDRVPTLLQRLAQLASFG